MTATITALPTPPSRGGSAASFSTAADAFLAALPAFGSEANTVAAELNGLAGEVQVNADAAASAAAAATAAANFKGNWSGLTGALAVPASVYHDNKIWLLLANLADVTTATPGVSASWLSLGAAGVTRFRVVSTAANYAMAARDFVEVTAAGKTVTLPLAPAVGEECGIAVGAFADTVVARNGQNIMGVAQDMTFNRKDKSIALLFVGGTTGWRIS